MEDVKIVQIQTDPSGKLYVLKSDGTLWLYIPTNHVSCRWSQVPLENKT